MNEQECLAKMVAPAGSRPSKPYRGGVIQIHVTRACDQACRNCTQGSQYAGKLEFMPVEMFERAVLSLKGYWGVVGVFGGNPAMHPQFEELCGVMRRHVPFEQRGLWCNNPINPSKGRAMRETFCPSISNLNVHLDATAYRNFKEWWPECNPVGLDRDSRHSPVFVSMRDVGVPEEERWELISRCDVNQHWSAMVGMFRGELRAWFCEVAGAQSILHQWEEGYSDTGLDPTAIYDVPFLGGNIGTRDGPWWQLRMGDFAGQVRVHCHDCGVPMRGYGALAQGDDEIEADQCSPAHEGVARLKRRGRRIELVTVRDQVREQVLSKVTHYLQNSTK